MKIKQTNSKYYISAIIIAIMIVFAVIYLLRVDKTASAIWWNDSWNYKKTITIDKDKVGIISDLGGTATSGQKNVTVKDGTLFTAGETVVIKDSVSRETNTVASIAGNVVTMQNNLANTYTTANNGFVKNTSDSVDLTDFPVLISLDSDASLASNARSDGYDISFISSNESTQLKHEIESYASSTGALIAWVKIPTLSVSQDTVIYMYYGNASASDQSDKTNVWDNSYKGVWHMNENPAGAKPQIIDSTISNYNGITGGTMTITDSVSGKIGNGIDFDGIDDFVGFGDILDIGTNDFTSSIWFKTTSSISGILGKSMYGSLAGRWSIIFSSSNPNILRILLQTNSTTYTFDALPQNGGVNWNDNNLHNATLVIDRHSNMNIYLDGAFNNGINISSAVAENINNTKYFFVGTYGNSSGTAPQYSSPNMMFTGILDEIRASNIVIPFDWIATEYKNQNSPSTFYILGSVEEKPVVSGLTASSTIFMGGSTSTTLLPPIIYYNFDEGYATTTYNYGTTTNSGVITGATWTNDGKFGKALSFSGSDSSYVSIPNVISGDDTHTISFWVKSVVGDKVLFDMSGNSGYSFIQLSATKLYVGYSPSTSNYRTYTYNFTLGRWYHVVVAKTGAGDNVSVYVDGKLLTSYIGSVANMNGGSLMYLGKFHNAGYAMTGFLDEVKIYNYALSADQVKLDYNQGVAMVMGSSGTSSSTQSSSLEYCVPGDTSYCVAPVAEYKFEKKSGTLAYDTSGNNNNGTITSAVSTLGKFGNAISFDGINDSLTKTSTSNLKSLNGTISYWLYIRNKGVGQGLMHIYQNNLDTSDYVRSYIHPSNLMDLIIEDDDVVKVNVYYDLDNLGDFTNKWLYVSWVQDGGSVKLYINGQLKSLSGTNSGSWWTNHLIDPIHLRIGRAWDYFDGSIDEVRIYNYARTPSQIAWDFNKGAPIVHYKFDECSDVTVHDESGNGGVGIITIGAGGSQNAAGTCVDNDTLHAWYNGRTGKYKASLSFDGTDDYVYGASNLGISGDAEFTMCAWVYWAGDNWSSNYPSFMGNNSTGVTNQGLSFTVNSGRPAIDFWVNRFRATNALSVKTWYHICGTKTPGIIGSTSKIYVDSKLVSGAVEGTNTTPNITNSVSIIGRLDATRWFNGKIDDAKFFNYALTSEQVKLEYSGSALKFN